MRKLFLRLIVMIALPAAAAATVAGQNETGDAGGDACRRLARWCARYRTGAVDIPLAEQYRRYAHGRTSFVTHSRDPGQARSARSGQARSARSGQAGVAAVVDRHRRYERGAIDARALARFLTGHDGGRKVHALAAYAELLFALHEATTTVADPETEARTAELLLGLAAHAFGGSLAAEADRWGVHRRRAPILVRREARRHLTRLAARSAAARQRLLAVVRDPAPLGRVALDPREIALRCLPAHGFREGETYRASRVLGEVLTRRGDVWVQLAAARLMAGMTSPFHATLLAKCLRAAASRIEAAAGSPGAVVALALAEAARAELARAHADRRLDAPWDRVPGGLHTLVERLVALVRDPALPVALRRRALGALEAAPHWGVVHALAIATAEADTGAMAAEVLAVVRRMTRFQGIEAKAWRRWHARHHAAKDGAIAPPAYADEPGPGRFYGIPLVGERILFVIDVSGSMADPLERRAARPERAKRAGPPAGQSAKSSKIGRTRAELIAAIERLDDRRRFDVLAFADAPTRMYGALVPATDSRRRDAMKRARSFDGSGWTDLGTAVLAAFGRNRLGEPRPVARPKRTRARSTDAETELPDQIILLSDGMPTRGPLFVPGDITDEVGRLNRALGVRIDAVALGAESDPFFLERLAQGNGGVLRVYPPSTEKAFDRLKSKGE